MRASDDETGPFIDFETPENGTCVPWELIGDILLGEQPAELWPDVKLTAHGKGIDEWHYFSVPGTFGAVSQEVVKCIGDFMREYFQFFPSTISDRTFYFLQNISSLDCLDRDRSDIVFFPHDASRVMRIKSYRFRAGCIADPLVFVIPETTTELFATQGVKRIIERHNLDGFKFLAADTVD
ncbi:MAG: hypothetical protein R3C18_09750 [Planctomycetaceae bacterium]